MMKESRTQRERETAEACAGIADQSRLDDKDYFGTDGSLKNPDRQPNSYEMGVHNTAVDIAFAIRKTGGVSNE